MVVRFWPDLRLTERLDPWPNEASASGVEGSMGRWLLDSEPRCTVTWLVVIGQASRLHVRTRPGVHYQFTSLLRPRL